MDATQVENIGRELGQNQSSVENYYRLANVTYEDVRPERAKLSFRKILRNSGLRQLAEAFGPDFLLGQDVVEDATYESKQGSDNSLSALEKRKDRPYRRLDLFTEEHGPADTRAFFSSFDTLTGVSTSGFISKTGVLFSSNSGNPPITYAVFLHK